MLTTKFISSILLLLLFAAAAFSQIDPGNDDDAPPVRRGEIIARVLGLTPEQSTEIRNLNRSGREKIRNAQENLRTARSELDQAIYADTYDEIIVQNKIKAVADAQAEIVKLRTENEVAVRRLLTPEQVVKFRDLRQRFADQRENRQRRRQQQRPNRRQNPLRRNRKN